MNKNFPALTQFYFIMDLNFDEITDISGMIEMKKVGSE